MNSTVIEKLLARGAGLESVVPGDVVVTRVDLAVLLDTQFFTPSWEGVRKVHDPNRIAIVLDHAVPAPGIMEASAGTRARKFAERHGIERFLDVGRHGIVHQVVAERGWAVPGQVLACSDSHTCAAGAFNVAARGLGAAEMMQIACTGTTWFQVPPTIRYDLVGSLAGDVTGKDVFLHIAGVYGDAMDHALEIGGPGLAELSMGDRRTIATQGAEVAADFTVFEADDLCLSYVAERTDAEPFPIFADAGAKYVDRRIINLSEIQPMVALPGSVINNTVPVDSLESVRIDQCFIGSCANGKIEDLEIAARILQNKKVAPGTRLIITPASQDTYLEASKRGYLTTFVEAGATVTNPTCGACFGYQLGVIGPGEVCLTASTRNFRGRMGSTEAEIYMASPATVAASAIAGKIVNPRSIA
ncbi:3-isopropylmalate dehydratase [Arthrobacter sp. SRS-W-1-2016]|uniref:3-isopropylmalate dehydratase large subunit n=1 Tax=Arthrobacter sp. SRS-W-1-2016 TaxID=1930254 RepID=UPI000990D0B7|nr:aconitase/3-isopropylmalate dehydratase large subunit family protein [Arthrobacter sp. SRS-W-1-2016]OOP63084.1 3-isopropylmalate dehydratase [Arthrobacter sp. SRS-W-1-2016]